MARNKWPNRKIKLVNGIFYLENNDESCTIQIV